MKREGGKREERREGGRERGGGRLVVGTEHRLENMLQYNRLKKNIDRMTKSFSPSFSLFSLSLSVSHTHSFTLSSILGYNLDSADENPKKKKLLRFKKSNRKIGHSAKSLAFY